MISKVKVIAAISGGIDSSFALALLLQHGYDVIGCHLLMSDNHEEDAERAKDVCHFLNIPCYFVDAKEKFKNEVIKPFINSYSRGNTPNPCILCNPSIKFKTLFEMLKKLGADFVATGHYARIIENNSNYHLARGKDSKKEQSYMLYRLKKEWLGKIIFPLGVWTKAEVKDKAKGIFGDMFSDVRESVDLCFLSERKTFRNFISAKIRAKKGPIISSQGDFLGCHEGAIFYTVGQREGLGLSNGPWYVLSIKEHDNTLIVGRKEDLYRRTVKCFNPHWLERPETGEVYTAQHRYKTTPKPVVLSCLDNDQFIVEALETPFWGVAPGQSLVIYDGEIVMGGGIIGDSTNSSSKRNLKLKGGKNTCHLC